MEKHQRGYETDEDILQNPVSYEEREKTVNITIDDVCMKKQKETREKQRAPKKEKRQSVNSTIVHIEKGGRSYRLNSLYVIDASHSLWAYACKLAFDLRRKGLTVPCAYIFIAASAISVSDSLIHADSHFDLIAKHSNLKAESLLPIKKK